MAVPTARPGDGFVYVYRSKVSHPSENTTLAPGNNARHPRARRKYDTAAIGDETNGHSERPTARTRARWMDGRTRRARARRDERQSDTRRRSRGSYIYFLLSPLVASSREGTDVVRHRRHPRIDPIDSVSRAPRAFPTSTPRGDGEGRERASDDDDDDDGPDRDRADADLVSRAKRERGRRRRRRRRQASTLLQHRLLRAHDRGGWRAAS